MKDITIKLSDRDARHYERLVKAGQFSSVEEAVKSVAREHMPELERLQRLLIDSKPLDSCAWKTQPQWIEYGNRKGVRIISPNDLGYAFKEGEVPENLKKVLRGSWLMTSGRISYHPNDLSARVWQNYGSDVVTPTSKMVMVPVLRGENLKHAIENCDAENYVGELFGIKGKRNTLISTLEEGTGRGAEGIFLYTPTQKSRKANPERPVRFDDLGRDFLVNGGYGLGSNGQSFKVYKNPRSGRKK